MNWYAYCENSPVVLVDPNGFESYIMYDIQFEREALNDRDALIEMGISGNEIILIPLVEKDDFEKAWNSMGVIIDENGNEIAVDIDHVIINTHAEVDDIVWHGEKGQKRKFSLESIGSLQSKNINGKVLVLGCNAGHLDHVGNNVASALAIIANGAMVVASDGTVKSRLYQKNYYTSHGDDIFRNSASRINGEKREHQGWVVYRYTGEHVTTRVADSGSKVLITQYALRLLY